MIDERYSRREILKLLATGIYSATAFTCPQNALASKNDKLSEMHPWTGDDFSLGHLLRDGSISAGLPEQKPDLRDNCEFAIIGGGLSGLCCAYLLKDTDFKLLEQYDQTGGHCQSGNHNGIPFALGAAYYCDNNGMLGQLVDELGLKPRKVDSSSDSNTVSKKMSHELSKDIACKDLWLYGKNWSGSSSTSQDLHSRNLAKLKELSRSLWEKFDGIVTAEKLSDPVLKRLDKEPMTEFLKGFDPEFIALLDNYLKSSLCEDTSRTSMLAGLSTIEDIFIPSFVLPGGNSAITSEIRSRLARTADSRIETGSFVISISPNSDGVEIIYRKEESLRKLQARHALIAIPHFLSARLLKNIPTRTKIELYKYKYGSYLVLNLGVTRQVMDGAFDFWLPSPYMVADITLSPFNRSGIEAGNSTDSLAASTKNTKSIKSTKSSAPRESSVLTLYCPFTPGSEGRTLLLEGNRAMISKRVLQELFGLFPDLENAITDIYPTRWGHSLAAPRSGYFELAVSLQNQESESFSFAHSSAHGLPSAEAAVQGAHYAVARALRSRSRSGLN